MREYLKELNKRYGYRPTWEPAKHLQLGDIGILEKGVFSNRTSLAEIGIDIEVREAAAGSDIQYVSEGGVTLQKKLSGEAPLPEMALSKLDAGITISFSKKNAILFAAKNARTAILLHMHRIEQEVFKLLEEGKWKKEWVIISELMQTDSATVLISIDQSSKFEIRANTEITAGELNIADADLDFKTTRDQNMQYTIVGGKGMTPLYRASGIRKRWFAPDAIRTKGLKPDDPDQPPLFEYIPLDDSEFE